nr:MAG: hypothetical protein [Microvirus sp.]
MVINQFSAIKRNPTLKGEVNNLPSMTVSNQSLSVRDIIERFTVGALLPQHHRPSYYDGLDDFDADDDTLRPDFDLSDVTMQSEEIKAALEAERIRKKEERSNSKQSEESDEPDEKRKVQPKKASVEATAENDANSLDDK